MLSLISMNSFIKEALKYEFLYLKCPKEKYNKELNKQSTNFEKINMKNL